MSYTFTLWHADHVNFGRLMNLLESELQRLHDDRSPDYELMLDIMHYMTHYSDVLHHPKEDLVFARIKARDQNVGMTVDRLTEEHKLLQDAGEAMVRELDDIVNGSILPREHVEVTVRKYIDGLRAHMRLEETTVLPVAARLLTEGDWADIDAAIATFVDPVFGSEAEDRYAALRQHINRQALADRAKAR